MDQLCGDIPQLWLPLTDEGSFGIVIIALLHKIINTDTVHTHSTRLHLELGIVDPGPCVHPADPAYPAATPR